MARDWHYVDSAGGGSELRDPLSCRAVNRLLDRLDVHLWIPLLLLAVAIGCGPAEPPPEPTPSDATPPPPGTPLEDIPPHLRTGGQAAPGGATISELPSGPPQAPAPRAAPSLPKIPPAGFALQQFGWLEGSWASVEDGVVTEEHWTSARGGTLLGMNRVSKADKTLFFQHLRLEAQGAAVFLVASPLAGPGVPFRAVGGGEMGAVFENPEQEFPQTLSYERTGDQLTVIGLGPPGDEQKRVEWVWQRVQ